MTPDEINQALLNYPLYIATPARRRDWPSREATYGTPHRGILRGGTHVAILKPREGSDMGGGWSRPAGSAAAIRTAGFNTGEVLTSAAPRGAWLELAGSAGVTLPPWAERLDWYQVHRPYDQHDQAVIDEGRGRVCLAVANTARFITLLAPTGTYSHFYNMERVTARRVAQETGLPCVPTGWGQYNVPHSHITQVWTPSETPVEVTGVLVRKLKSMSKKELRAEVKQARQTHKDDMTKVSQALINEANNRDWCDDYDRVIEGVNDSLTVPLDKRRTMERRTINIVATSPYNVGIMVPTDATTEEIEEAAQVWARANVSSSAEVTEVTAS